MQKLIVMKALTAISNVITISHHQVFNKCQETWHLESFLIIKLIIYINCQIFSAWINIEKHLYAFKIAQPHSINAILSPTGIKTFIESIYRPSIIKTSKKISIYCLITWKPIINLFIGASYKCVLLFSLSSKPLKS